MSNWCALPKGSWTQVGTLLSGFGTGEGSYNGAYVIDTSRDRFLNGRVSARFRLAADRSITGAGLVCRANEFRSYIAGYVVTDDSTPDLFGLRIAAFKDGKFVSLVGLKQAISIPGRQLHMALQFYSGDIVSEVTTRDSVYTLKYVLPQVPFPGHCGAVRFYGTAVTVQGIQIEEMRMKPILPEKEDDVDKMFPFTVFLSHSSADKPTVLSVIEAFKEAGISYWVDHEQITFGDGIIAKIEDGLRKSRYVVACLSENLDKSGWCRAEYGSILYREYSGDTTRRVIPLTLDGSTSSNALPLLLSDKMRADLTNPESFKAFIQFLRNTLTTT